MSHQDKVQLTIVFTATPDLVAEGERIFNSHAAWMERTHHRDGDQALLSYDLSKGAELSNPLDPSSEPTGNTQFCLSEVYESQAGIDDHWQQAMQSWDDFSSMVEWAQKCNPTTVHSAGILHSLW
jgi:quinol monooxygenase YgiN